MAFGAVEFRPTAGMAGGAGLLKLCIPLPLGKDSKGQVGSELGPGNVGKGMGWAEVLPSCRHEMGMTRLERWGQVDVAPGVGSR